MGLFGAFHEFTRRVLSAVKKGGLRAADITRLSYLLKKTDERNKVLAQGILSALRSGGAKESEISKLADLLKSAERRILLDQDPFTAAQKKELARILDGKVPKRTERWFRHVDALVAEEVRAQVKGSRRRAARPVKTVRLPRKKKRKRAALR